MAADIKYEIILYWSKQDQSFIAEFPELPGCAADGAIYQEAVANVEVVIQEWIEIAQELGRLVPEPRLRSTEVYLSARACHGRMSRRAITATCYLLGSCLMSEVMLIDLEGAQGLGAALGGLEGLRKLFIEQTRALVPIVLQLAESSRARWIHCVRAVAAGKTPQVHALRDELFGSLQSRLDALKEAHRLASMAAVLAGEDLPGSAGLPAAIQDLERLRLDVFSRWQTAEDLEALSVRDYPLSQERLEQLAKSSPPPAEWYTEDEERPF